MNNVFVYCELEGTVVAEVSLELLTKGRKLANQLGCQLEAVVADTNLAGIEKQVLPFGVDRLHIFDAPGLFPYTSLPHSSVLINLFKEEKPQICLMGATVIGRDLGPRVSSALTSGLTADCTSLEIGEHEDKKEGKVYENLLYQIRPAFGGNIVATIVNPEHRPQMATVREGVMKKEILDTNYQGEVINHDVAKYVPTTDYVVKVIDRHVEKAKHNLKGAPIVVAGGYGMGSREGFNMLFELAKELHAEVGGSRAAVDAGFCDHDRQIGQTGVTVRPKLYIACGISGQIQHIAGMQESGIIISINNDENAPINTIADYVINGTVEEVIPKMIKYYKKTVNKFINEMKGVIIALCLFCTCGMLNAQNKLPKNGKHVYSYANGNDSIVCFYKNGRLVGQRTEYYPNGQIRLISTYKNGRKLNLKQYYENGALKREEVMNGDSSEGHLYDIDGKELDFIPYIELPQFPGGNAELSKLIAQYTKYPRQAIKDKKQGLVLIKCSIDKEGNPKMAEVVKSVCPELDKEAMRVVGFLTMTYKFTPGKIEGQPANMHFTIPVNFRL